ncbi:MAG: hydrogenase [Candidatus Omnitrophica bacterium]|nr:hydrogenase [Candidatus Omnitrophota bacterium]
MNFFLYSLAFLVFSVFLMLFSARLKKITSGIFLCSLIVGSVLAIISAIKVLVNQTSLDYHAALRMPIGEFYLGLDALSAFFVFTISVLFLMSGIYGYFYLQDCEKKNLNAHYSIYNLCLVFLLILVTAKNAVLFLIAWEMVTVCAYFMIIFYDQQKVVRKAGYLYLIAAHTGTFCLFIMFLLMQHNTVLSGGQAGSMNFDQMLLTPFSLPLAGLIFVLAILGFGVKTGFMPMHIWLPHAHPVAPSHVSAILSGVIIKIGIYGLLRIILIIKDFPQWCAVLLLFIGMISGVGGVLYALGQHEIKKLLAYHSIENIGIITLGLGIGLWGQINQNEMVALLGYAGALLHVFNHAVFKGLLFLSAGSVIKATHTGEMDKLGGLLKYLPWTGHLFLIGAVSICGLPLFNGFISEWLVYRALFENMFQFKINAIVFCSLAIIALSLIGGLAIACFAKAFGAIFLGNSRCLDNKQLKENSLFIAPMIVLGGICLWIGLFPKTMVSFVLRAASVVSAVNLSPIKQSAIISPLITMGFVLALLILTIVILGLLKKISMNFSCTKKAQTWGCGYSLPTSRMQYTASSFAEPILRIFRNILGFTVKGNKPSGYFPKEERISAHVVEVSEEFIFKPIFQGIQFLASKLKIIQVGFVQLYLLYIIAFLLLLLIWKIV